MQNQQEKKEDKKEIIIILKNVMFVINISKIQEMKYYIFLDVDIKVMKNVVIKRK